jgi:hypothetical protein
MYSASAFAANTMVRSAVGAAFPLFTRQMYEGMGVNWASTLIGGIALMLLPIPFLFYKYGPRIRAKKQVFPSPVRFPYHLAQFAPLTSPDHRTSRSQKRLRRNAGPRRKVAKYRVRHCIVSHGYFAHDDTHPYGTVYTNVSITARTVTIVTILMLIMTQIFSDWPELVSP